MICIFWLVSRGMNWLIDWIVNEGSPIINPLNHFNFQAIEISGFWKKKLEQEGQKNNFEISWGYLVQFFLNDHGGSLNGRRHKISCLIWLCSLSYFLKINHKFWLSFKLQNCGKFNWLRNLNELSTNDLGLGLTFVL